MMVNLLLILNQVDEVAYQHCSGRIFNRITICFRRLCRSYSDGALVAVMIMVSIGTFDWNSVTTIHKVPKGNAFVMM